MLIRSKYFFFMKTETQTLIVLILGLYALVSLVGLLLLVGFTTYDVNIILALVTVTTTPISILGGFIAGKTLTEKQSEDLFNQQEEVIVEEECLTEMESA